MHDCVPDRYQKQFNSPLLQLFSIDLSIVHYLDIVDNLAEEVQHNYKPVWNCMSHMVSKINMAMALKVCFVCFVNS